MTKTKVGAPDVVTLGEPLGALRIGSRDNTRAQMGVEGDVLNVAIGLARAGVSVGLVSAVGDGRFGQMVLKTLVDEGVDTSHLRTVAGARTGIVMREVGGPLVEYDHNHSAASLMTTDDIPWDYVLSARHLHLTGILPALSAATYNLTIQAMKRARAAGMTVSFDPTLCLPLWSDEALMRRSINNLADLADWVLPNLKEAQKLTGRSDLHEIADFYFDSGVSLVVVKLGAEGAYVRTHHGFELTVQAEPIKRVVDKRGAGDAFAAGLIGAAMAGQPWHQAAERGNFVASRVVQRAGEWEGAPYLHQYPNSALM